MTDEDKEKFERVVKILFPFYHGAREMARAKGVFFAHYTTAETALKIIRSGQIWLRAATTMNDASEVRHGLECLGKVWNGAAGAAFKASVDGVQAGASAALEKLLVESLNRFTLETHLACFSEFDPYDQYGRLSMWRAYGGSSGVAILLKPAPFFMEARALGVAASPVAYFEPEAFGSQMMDLAVRISTDSAFLRESFGNDFHTTMWHVIRMGVLCAKHPGFQEEREWRVTHTAGIDHNGGLVGELETVKGIPQLVLKLKLEDLPDQGLQGLALKSSLHKIILGPTQFEAPMFKAFHLAMQEAGIDPTDKIASSRIPLRM